MPPSDTLDELRRCLAVLRALAKDRSPIHELPESEMAEFFESMGRILYPVKNARSRLARAKRQAEKKLKREKDRRVTATTQIVTVQAPG